MTSLISRVSISKSDRSIDILAKQIPSFTINKYQAHPSKIAIMEKTPTLDRENMSHDKAITSHFEKGGNHTIPFLFLLIISISLLYFNPSQLIINILLISLFRKSSLKHDNHEVQP